MEGNAYGGVNLLTDLGSNLGSLLLGFVGAAWHLALDLCGCAGEVS